MKPTDGMKMWARVIRDLKPGDFVMLLDPNSRPRKTRVVKAGTKNVYVEAGSAPFDRETGKIKDKYGNEEILAVVAYQARVAVEEARKRLGELGIRFDRTVTAKRVLSAMDALREWAKM